MPPRNQSIKIIFGPTYNLESQTRKRLRIIRAFRHAAAIITVIAFSSCFLMSIGTQAGFSHCLLRAAVIGLLALVLITIIEKIVIGLSR